MSETGNGKNGRLIGRLRHETRTFLGVVRPRLGFWSSCASVLPDFSLAPIRARMYRWAGCDLGEKVALLGPINLVGPGDVAARLRIGDGSIIAPGVTFCLDAGISIGRNVSLGPRVTLYTATHSLGFGSQRMNPTPVAKEIVIEDGVWIGAHCIILPGVRLGQGCVASAGAVIGMDVPPNTLVAGNPAVVTKELAFGSR